MMTKPITVFILSFFIQSCSENSNNKKSIPINSDKKNIFLDQSFSKNTDDKNDINNEGYSNNDTEIVTSNNDLGNNIEAKSVIDNTQTLTAETNNSIKEINISNIISNHTPIITRNSLSISQGEMLLLNNSHFNGKDDNVKNIKFIISDMKNASIIGGEDNLDGTIHFSMEQLLNDEIKLLHNGYALPPTLSLTISNGISQTGPENTDIRFEKKELNNSNNFFHPDHFSQLPKPIRNIIPEYYSPSTDWYRSSYHLSKYGNYGYLHDAYQGYLPTGKTITVLQAESDHTPASAGTVNHLVKFENSGSHSETVSSILNQVDTYPALYTQYNTYSTDLKNFHTIDTADLRDFVRTQMTKELR